MEKNKSPKIPLKHHSCSPPLSNKPQQVVSHFCPSNSCSIPTAIYNARWHYRPPRTMNEPLGWPTPIVAVIIDYAVIAVPVMLTEYGEGGVERHDWPF